MKMQLFVIFLPFFASKRADQTLDCYVYCLSEKKPRQQYMPKAMQILSLADKTVIMTFLLLKCKVS